MRTVAKGCDLSYQLIRPFGMYAGEFTENSDFNDPLPEHVIEEFEGRR